MGERSIDILTRLISFDTVSRNTNLPLIDWVEDYLSAHGVKSRRIPDETGEKASLVTTIGPEGVAGYVLSGHTDVVPVDGQDWSSDPFTAEIRDGLLYGRGSADMKGFDACVLAAVPRMTGLKRPLHIAFSYDEEIGCLGVRPLLRDMAAWPVKPLGCFVGEPTGMQVVTGHKHKISKRAIVRGRAGHSSLAPNYVNAAEYAARLITVISDIGRRLRAEGARDDLYDMPHTTAHVGRMTGGAQLNIVPEHAEFDFEFRAIAADDPAALMEEVADEAQRLSARMQAVDPATGVDFLPLSDVNGLDTDADAGIVTLAKRLAGRNDHARVAYGTEGGLFQSMADIPTVVCGPGHIAVAHKADEHIALDQLAACDTFLDNLIDHCRTGA